VILLTSLDNANLLRALEVFAVVLVWLFLFRVVRAAWVEVKPPRMRREPPPVVDRPPPAQRRSGRGRGLRLRVVEPETERGRTYEVGEEITVGRAPGCGVRVDDAFTSSIHARLYPREGSLWVEDLGSTNGTWVNAEQAVGPTRMSRGDVLQVGGTVFEVAR
jgi:hypothetical protein